MHTKNSTQHTPTPWEIHNRPNGSLWITNNGRTVYDSEAPDVWPLSPANAAFIIRAVNAHDELVAALSGLLEQATGPTEVYGDGIGKDGTKTGLSHWEFNQLRDERIAKARAVLAKL